jgi:hypothetical protein
VVAPARPVGRAILCVLTIWLERLPTGQLKDWSFGEILLPYTDRTTETGVTARFHALQQRL